MAAVIAAIGSLYAGLFGYELGNYLPYLALGLIIWNIVSSLMTSGCQTFIAGSGSIKQIKAPLSIYLYQLLWRELLTFGHDFVLVPIVLTIFNQWPGWVGLLAIPGFILMFLTCGGLAMSFGIVSARYRDFPPIVAMITRFAFFFTPIIWNADKMPSRAAVVIYNPFYYLLEVVRAPLLGKEPALFVWIVTVLLMIASWIVAITLYTRYRHRLAFWV